MEVSDSETRTALVSSPVRLGDWVSKRLRKGCGYCLSAERQLIDGTRSSDYSVYLFLKLKRKGPRTKL
ncbi:hypothetical protein LshimejAT787_0600300 [Lyophyllum shimeji]|uniref:Uncharacterized protein n=1 Tax=Lyophyllum shimeji TaxID=47721 RepID=A0A9P3PNV4_LYOSH|nr:hypothetical protein LshimejAT787_0600300 [Lyophyllum shimeji]